MSTSLKSIFNSIIRVLKRWGVALIHVMHTELDCSVHHVANFRKWNKLLFRKSVISGFNEITWVDGRHAFKAINPACTLHCSAIHRAFNMGYTVIVSTLHASCSQVKLTIYNKCHLNVMYTCIVFYIISSVDLICSDTLYILH